ncbi:MAG TPA: hypothetical protein VHK91_18320 [Flavisolibacter sp.]|jgi:hypothetical protein|nr:hypothetical protein [Flavisolibacter sp.]
MKRYFSIYALLFLLAAVSLVSCGQTGAAETKLGVAATAQEQKDNSIHFKVDGQTISTSGWNISRFDMGKGLQLNVTTNMHEDKRTVLLNINGVKPGIYKLGSGSRGDGTGYGSYKPDYNDMLNSFRFTEGEFELQTIDTMKGFIEARFQGTVMKGDQQFRITDGVIHKGALRSGITTY